MLIMGKMYRVIPMRLQVKKEKDKTENGEMNIINVSSSCEKVLVSKYIYIFHTISIF